MITKQEMEQNMKEQQELIDKAAFAELIKQGCISSLIKTAIEKRIVIEFDYNEEGLRECEPHALYRNKKGEILVDCYQTCGHSSQGLPAWKQFKLNKISDLTVIDGLTYGIQKGFNPESTRYVNLIKKVE